MHICKEYATGYGHIDQHGERFMVSFYGRRVRQVEVGSLESARYALRHLAQG